MSEDVGGGSLLYVTANTGHSRRSLRDEADSAWGLRVPLALAAVSGEHVAFGGPEGWTFEVSQVSGALLVRVRAPDGQAVVEFAVGADAGEDALVAWRRVMKSCHWHIGSECDRPRDPPWLIVALLPALADHPEAVAWLADVEKLAAWSWLEARTPEGEFPSTELLSDWLTALDEAVNGPPRRSPPAWLQYCLAVLAATERTGDRLPTGLTRWLEAVSEDPGRVLEAQ